MRIGLFITVFVVAVPSASGLSTPSQIAKRTSVAKAHGLSPAEEAVDRLRRVDSTGEEAVRRSLVGSTISREKQAVLAFGTQAIPPLLALLASMLEEWKSDRDQRQDVQIVNVERAFLTIGDCCELLGRLKAVEGVPLILEVIERKLYFSMVPKMDTKSWRSLESESQRPLQS